MNRQSEQLFSKNCCAKALVVFIIDYSLCKELMHLITVFFFFRCGIIVEFKLEFNQSVVASEVMTTLQEAAKRGTVGGFQINSIKQISPQPATPTEGTIYCRSLKKCNFFFIDLLIMQKASGILLRPENVLITR